MVGSGASSPPLLHPQGTLVTWPLLLRSLWSRVRSCGAGRPPVQSRVHSSCCVQPRVAVLEVYENGYTLSIQNTYLNATLFPSRLELDWVPKNNPLRSMPPYPLTSHPTPFYPPLLCSMALHSAADPHSILFIIPFRPFILGIFAVFYANASSRPLCNANAFMHTRFSESLTSPTRSSAFPSSPLTLCATTHMVMVWPFLPGLPGPCARESREGYISPSRGI